MEKSKPLSITLTAKNWQKLTDESERTGLSKSAIVTFALDKYFTEREENRDK